MDICYQDPADLEKKIIKNICTIACTHKYRNIFIVEMILDFFGNRTDLYVIILSSFKLAVKQIKVGYT